MKLSQRSRTITGSPTLVGVSELHSGCVNLEFDHKFDRLWKVLGLLVPVNSTRYRASISGLSTPWSRGGP
jgi:hypothetical protein